MANKISPNQITYRKFLIGHYAKCFYLNPTSPTEVANIVHSLKNSKCEGFYGPSISPVKDTIDLIAALWPISVICHFLTVFFQISSKQPRSFPSSNVINSSLFSKYRPIISILPCLSKVFEKLFYFRLSGFLEKFDILSHHQYGFRPHLSTTIAILEFVNNIYEGFESNEYNTLLEFF